MPISISTSDKLVSMRIQPCADTVLQDGSLFLVRGSVDVMAAASHYPHTHALTTGFNPVFVKLDIENRLQHNGKRLHALKVQINNFWAVNL